MDSLRRAADTASSADLRREVLREMRRLGVGN